MKHNITKTRLDEANEMARWEIRGVKSIEFTDYVTRYWINETQWCEYGRDDVFRWFELRDGKECGIEEPANRNRDFPPEDCE